MADRRHVLYGVKIIIERQLIDNVWQSHRWIIHDLVPLNLRAGDGPPPSNNIHFERLRQRESGEEKLSFIHCRSVVGSSSARRPRHMQII